SPTGAGVVPGTSVTDTATVSGGQGQPTPTGTVDFFLCQPADVTANGCESGGTKVGATKTLANGQATSDATANTTSECFTTGKQPSTTATTSSPTGAGVVPGTSVTDTATVSGGQGQPTPT